MIDWTDTYFALMQPVAYRPAEVVKWQGGNPGGCWSATVAYAMEMLGILQGYPPRQLSARYNAWTDGTHSDTGTNAWAALGAAMSFGLCREEFMPAIAYAGIDTTTIAYSKLAWGAVYTPPDAAAVADGVNQVITDWATLNYSGENDLRAKCQAEIAAGHVLCVLTAQRTHVMVAWGFDDSGLIGLNSQGQSRDRAHTNWNQVGGIAAVVRGVRFANAVMGPKPTPLPKPVVVVVPPPPPVARNTQMLIDTYKAQVNALQVGQITAAQLAAIDATRAQIVPDAAAGPPPPPSADGVTVPPDAAIVEPAGVWTLGTAGGPERGGVEILLNGRQFGGGFAKMLLWKGGKMYHLNTSNQWFVRVGGGWKQTSAP